MDDAIRSSLETLRKEFQRAASMYPAIYHQQLLECGLEMTRESWWAFAAANPSPKEWHLWHGPVDGKTYDWFGRFSGAEAGLTEFQQLAESLYLVLRKLDPDYKPDDGLEENSDNEEHGDTEENFGFEENVGFKACLGLLHEVAAQWPTPLVRSKETRWGLGENHEAKKEAYAKACTF